MDKVNNALNPLYYTCVFIAGVGAAWGGYWDYIRDVRLGTVRLPVHRQESKVKHCGTTYEVIKGEERDTVNIYYRDLYYSFQGLPRR